MLNKDGQVKEGVTRCDHCGAPATTVSPAGKASCAAHQSLTKNAAPAEPALKSAADGLAQRFQ